MKIKKTLESIARGLALTSVLAFGGCTAPKTYDNAIYSASFQDLTAKKVQNSPVNKTDFDRLGSSIDVNNDGLSDQFLISPNKVDLRVSNQENNDSTSDYGILQFEYLPDNKTFKMSTLGIGGSVSDDHPSIFRRLYPIENFIFDSPADATNEDSKTVNGRDELDNNGNLVRRAITYTDSFPKFAGLRREEYFSKTGRLIQAVIEDTQNGEALWAAQFNPLTNSYDVQLDKLNLTDSPSKQ